MKIRVVSENEDLQTDLIAQMSRYIEDFQINEDNPDIIIVDEDFPTLEKMRKIFVSVPFVFLTSNNATQIGQMDFTLHKPFSLKNLMDIIYSANNKLDNSAKGILIFNQYKLQPNARTITDLLTGKETKLTEKEVNILKYLYKNANHFVGKTDLQVNVWQYNEEVTTHTIETHIYRLRQKVETTDSRRLIITENGKYKLNTE